MFYFVCNFATFASEKVIMSVENKNAKNILWNLAKCYLKGSLEFSLTAEDAEILTWGNQKAFLDYTIHTKLLQKYPVNNEFSKLFFKKLINSIEPYQEIHDECYSCLCFAMKANNSNDFCYRHYIIGSNLDNIVTIKETNNMVVNGTTGMRTWEAALMLADWAINNQEIFENKLVLELGSGVGFTGIAIARQCKIKSMVLTDYHNDVLNTIKNNIEINFPEDKPLKKNMLKLDIKMLDWNDINDFPQDLVPDIVIGADIVYDPSILQPLCNVIKYFYSKNKQLDVYVASTIRNEDTFNSFLQTLESNDLNHFTLPQVCGKSVEWDHSNKKMSLLKVIQNK